MKLLLLLSVFVGVSASAQEETFTMTKGGRDYLCQAIDSGGGDPVDCVNKAYNGPFSSAQARELCEGATSVAPAECAIKAYNGPFSSANSILLCKHARSTGPVECAIKAYNGPFSSDQSLRLCSGNGSIRRAECAIKAYNGPYSSEESIQICQNANLNLLMRSLNLINSSPEALKKSQQFKLQMSLK